MKTRNGFVSNSSSSSFIVEDRIFDWKKKEFIYQLSEEEREKLEKFGFHRTNSGDASHVDYNFEDDKNATITWGIDVSVNQADVIDFLVKNNIPFIGSCHYDHYTAIYHKGSEYVLEIANFGKEIAMYRDDRPYTDIINDYKGDECIRKVPVETYDENYWLEQPRPKMRLYCLRLKWFFKHNILDFIKRFLPLQWWVKETDNWCKTSWKYVLTGQHKGQKKKLGNS